MLFERSGPVGLSLRTSLLCELEALTGCSMTWKQRVTPAGRSWWVLAMSGRPTSATACSSWPTALAREGGPSSSMNSDLPRDVQAWPTPRANESSGGEYQRDRGVAGQERPTLLGRANNWPTPTATEYGSNQGGSAGRVGPKRPSPDGTARAFPLDPTTTPDGEACSELISALPRPCRLNVRFVEWLMGFPRGWVDAGAGSL